MRDVELSFVQLAQLLGSGRLPDAVILARRTLPGILKDRPDLRKGLLAAQKALAGSAARAVSQSPLPVDTDSRLQLLRREDSPTIFPEPVWPPMVAQALSEVLAERSRQVELLEAGLSPSRSLLFVGPPGVGKTLAARWLAAQSGCPLLTLDLASVMSSFLGRTGNNIRSVLDYAQKFASVLLLDEFDAIAKRRDDATEVGELKRLVTVILQTVDEWPPTGLLIAATNHPELLDPAVWRRFDRVIHFPLPDRAAVGSQIARLLDGLDVSPDVMTPLAIAVEGESFADIARRIQGLRRKVLVEEGDLSVSILELAAQVSRDKEPKVRADIGRSLIEAGFSQRDAAKLTGVSRDTLRKLISKSK